MGDELYLGSELTLPVWVTDTGVVIFSRILGEISEFNTLGVGPKEVENQFQSDEQTIIDDIFHTIALTCF